MAEFKVNADMFGMYARIPTGYSKEMHVYKVVSKFKSNSYCDVPIVYNSKPVIHDKEFSQLSDLEDVLNVIHCGIDETKVIRVALKDCEIVKPTADVVEVVRCKDCKYLTNEVILVPTPYGFDNEQINFGCQRISDITDEWADVMLDDFCSYGEKIESEVEK